MNPKFEILLSNESDTEKLGQALSLALKSKKKEIETDGLAIRLTGALGAGKTTLTRAVLRAMGYERRVKSPTFALLEQYKLNEFLVNHFDFYRFEDPEEFEEAGFRENFGPGQVTLSEWTVKAEPFVPACDLEIQLENTAQEEARKVQITAFSENGQSVLREVENAWS